MSRAIVQGSASRAPLSPLHLASWYGERLCDAPSSAPHSLHAGDLLVLLVSGPAVGEWFHVNASDEFLYQVRGEATLELIDGCRLRAIRMSEGFGMTVPAGVAHRPVRLPKSVGVVVERRRAPHELERFCWYCRHCACLLHAVNGRAGQSGDALLTVEKDLASSPCSSCGETPW
jgi:3-hydroxyanthranilate 3,4-dioxygenase